MLGRFIFVWLLVLKKSFVLSIIFVIASIVLLSWSVIVIAAVNGVFRDDRLCWGTDNPSLAFTQKGGYYNISLAFHGVQYNETIDGIVLTTGNCQDFQSLTRYVNGTALAKDAPVSFKLHCGDEVAVNFVFPMDDLPLGTRVNIRVFGNSSGCGGYITT